MAPYGNDALAPQCKKPKAEWMDGNDKTNTTLSCPNELALILIYVPVRARNSPPVDNENSKLCRIRKKDKKKTHEMPTEFRKQCHQIRAMIGTIDDLSHLHQSESSLSGRNCWFYNQSIGFRFSEAISGGDRIG